MEEPTPTPTSTHWTILVLLVISACISYVDRGNLSVAARSLATELHFRPDQLGILLGAFFWTYSFCQLFAGKVIGRWNVVWVLAIAYFAWSLATAFTGLASTFSVFFALRLLLGVGESMAYPAFSKILATGYPEHLRGAANGLIDAGSKVGPALGVLVGVKLVNLLTWRGMFIALGAVSLLWLVPWCLAGRRLPFVRENAETAETATYRQLLRERALWGTVIGLFGANYVWYLLLTWLPYYFETERHYTHDRLALIASLPFWAVAVSSTLCGFLADSIIRKGSPAVRVRQRFVSAGLLACSVFSLLTVLVPGAFLSNLVLVLACVSFGFFSSNHWALTQSLAGPRAAAKWTGFENCIGNLAGVAAAYLSGVVLRETHSFVLAFAIAAAAALIGAIGFWFVIGKSETVVWQKSVTALTSRTY